MEDPIGKSNQEEKQTSNDYLKLIADQLVQMNTKFDDLKTEISNMKKELSDLKNDIRQIKKGNIKETAFQQYENGALKKDKNNNYENENENVKISPESSSSSLPRNNLYMKGFSGLQSSKGSQSS